MDELNYNHLYYFWVVARQGSIVRAGEELLISQPTISAQLKTLETALGEPLFNRVGRRLVLTEVGHTVFQYANDMFSLGQALMDAVKQRATHRPLQIKVGVADVLHKSIIHALLTPILKLEPPIRLSVEEHGLEHLLIDLASRRLDMVLSDFPVGRESSIRTFNHLLGETGVTFFAARPLAHQLARAFPKSLNGAPMFLPTTKNAVRRSLDQWFDTHGIRPQIMGEFDDSAMLERFGDYGVFPAPTVSGDDVRRLYDVAVVGHAEGVVERYYAISVDRKLTHPAVAAITEAAHNGLFSEAWKSRPKK